MSELVYIGGALKALDENGKVGGYLVRFSDASRKDLDGEYFTKSTYFGARDADGADCLMHHMQPLPDVPRELTDHIFHPLKTKKDDIGIFAETILDLADKYEKKVFELISEGKLGFSSGAAAHTVIKGEDGEIKRWLIAEGSFTPIPAEPQNKVMSLKSYADLLKGEEPTTKGMFEDMLSERVNNLYFLNDLFISGCYQLMWMDEAAEDTQTPFDLKQKYDELGQAFLSHLWDAMFAEDTEEDAGDSSLKSNLLAGLPFSQHSDTALAAVQVFTHKATALCSILADWSGRFKSISELRIKEGRVVSQTNKQKVSDMHGKLKEAHSHIKDVMDGMEDLMTLADKKEETTDHMKVMSEIQSNLMQRRNRMRLIEVA